MCARRSSGGWRALALALLLWIVDGGRALAHARPAAFPVAPGWIAESWTTEDGLPVNVLEDIAIDRQGVLWAASHDGLVRLDGSGVTVLRPGPPDGPPTVRLRGLRVHPSDGALWVVGEHGQLQRRPPGAPPTTPAAPSTTILVSDGHDLWVRTAAGPQVLRAAPVSPGPGDAVPAEIAHPSARVWLHGVDPGDIDGTDVEEARRPHPRAVAVPGATVLRPVEGTIPDATSIDPSTPPVWELGAVEVDGATVRHAGQTIATLPAPASMPLVAGDEIWIATRGAGLVRLRPSPVSVHRAPDGQPTNVQRLWWDARTGSLWAHARHAGWWPVIGPARAALPAPPETLPPEDRAPWTVYPFRDAAGTAWLGTAHHLLRATDDGGWEERTPAGWDHSGPAGQSTRGTWISGAHSPLVFWDGTALHPVTVGGTPLRDVLTVHERPDGSLWLGGVQGLAALAPGSWQARPVDLGRTTGGIRELRRSGANLWLATVDAGLCALPADTAPDAGALRCLGPGSPLDRSTVHHTVDDGAGRTWIGTNQGIGVVETERLQDWADGGPPPPVLWLDTDDGMASAEVNGFAGQGVVRVPDGRLFFATQDGVVEVDPARFALPAAPQVGWRRVTVGGAPVAAGSPLSLPTQHGTIELAWSVPPSPWEDDITVRTRLAPDQPWSAPTRSRTLTLAQLAPGPSTVEVPARLAGDWGPVARLALAREPAWTEQAAAPVVGCGVVVLLIAGLLGARGQVTARRNRELQRFVDAQTDELASQNAALMAANGALHDANTALSEANRHLSVRTRELAHSTESLRASNAHIAAQAEQLQRLDVLKTQLLTNVSHELRTPLSLILTPLGVALETPALPPAVARQLQVAADSAARLDTLIDQLFELSRVQAGGTPLRVRPLDLGHWLRAAHETFTLLAEQAGVALVAELPPAPVACWADDDALQKIVGNLITNALRHAPRGSTVALRLRATDEHACIVVADQGPGIPDWERERVFGRFVQLDGAPDTSPGGAGVGLSLARELVLLHGGEIGVDDANPGAAFWVRLPLGVAHLTLAEVDPYPPALGPTTSREEPVRPGAGAPSPAPPVQAAPARAPGGRPRVLLVEDDTALRTYLAALLDESFDVDTAPEGQAALDRLAVAPADLVISDVAMDGLGGWALARALRQHPTLAALPILFISARHDVPDRVESLALGDDFLAKPFDARELVARARALLRRDSPEPPPAAAPQSVELCDQLRAVALPHLAARDFGASALAAARGMSLRALQQQMRDLDLASPAQWLRELRVDTAHASLQAQPDTTVEALAREVGMSRSYFTRIYRARFGQSPGEAITAQRSAGTPTA